MFIAECWCWRPGHGTMSGVRSRVRGDLRFLSCPWLPWHTCDQVTLCQCQHHMVTATATEPIIDWRFCKQRGQTIFIKVNVGQLAGSRGTLDYKSSLDIALTSHCKQNCSKEATWMRTILVKFYEFTCDCPSSPSTLDRLKVAFVKCCFECQALRMSEWCRNWIKR